MATTSNRKEQQITNNQTGVVSFVTVDSNTTYETRHAPTSTELATIKSALPTGYTWSVVNAVSSGGGNSIPSTYQRGIIVGNSFTSHTASTALNWPNNNGMAASSLANDYVHKIEAAIKVTNPSFEIMGMGQGSSLEGSYNSSDADAVLNTVNNIKYDIEQRWGVSTKLDLLILSISENVDNNAFNETKFRSMLDQFFAGLAGKLNSGATIIMRNGCWLDHEQADVVLQSYASQKGYKFANMSDIKETLVGGQRTWPYYATQFSDSGVRRHPNDAGHAAIAERFIALLKTGAYIPPVAPPSGGGNTDFVAYADQGWSGEDMKYIQSGIAKAGFKRSVGACLCYLAENDGENYINDLQIDGQSDKGRQGQFASNYRRPGNTFTTPAGAHTNQYGFDTGDNVVQGGSLYPFLAPSTVLASAIVQHPTKGQMFYAKVRPKFWSVPNEDGYSTDEIWCWMEGRSMGYFTRHTILYAAGSQSDFQSMQQENPCVYIQANAWQQFVQLTPGGGDYERTVPTTGFSKTVLAAGCWVGSYKPGGGKGVTVYTPGNSNFTTAQFGERAGGWSSGPSAYVSVSLGRNYSNAGVYEDSGYIIIGTMAEAKSAMNSLPARNQSFDFDFTTTNIWSNNDSRVIRASNGELTWYCGDAKTDNGQTNVIGNFLSPAGYYDASSIVTLEIEMAVTGTNIMGLKFIKHGLLDETGTEFRKTFAVTGDGIMRTYQVSTAHANFNGQVATIGLEAPYGQMPQGAKAIIKRIRKV